MTILPLYLVVGAVMRQGSDDAYLIADYLNKQVPQDAVVETWEPELGILTNLNYHYPPQIVLAYAVDEIWRDGQPANELYDFHKYVDPDYVVVGPFAEYTYLYPPESLGERKGGQGNKGDRLLNPIEPDSKP